MKATRVVIHILHDEIEQAWQVLREGTTEPESVHSDRCSAIAAGRELAKGERGQLVIHKSDGSIQRECTYGYSKCWLSRLRKQRS